MHSWVLSSLVVVALALAGCSKSGGSAGASASVDPSPIEKAFSSAEPTIKAAADKAVSAIKGADYSGALAELQKLGANVKLTDEQKKAINDVLAKVQKAVAEAGTKASGEASKALDGVQKSLGK